MSDMTQRDMTEDDAIDLGALFGLLYKRKFTILSITFLVTLLGVAFAYLSTPIYQADALVQLEEKSSGGLALSADLADMLGGRAPQSVAEIEILRSRMILGDVVETLNLNWSAKPRRLPVIGLLVPELHQPLAHELGLVLVDLATERDGSEKCGHSEGLTFRFDRGRHRPLAASDQTVAAKGMNLVSLQFRVFHGGCQADCLALAINLGGQFVALVHRVPEQGPHHLDHVLVGVILVIPENDV